MIEFTRRRLVLTAGLGLLTASMLAQDPTPANVPSYEVVAVKPHNSAENMTRLQTSQDRFTASGVTLKNLIEFAYDLKMEDQVTGAPGWTGSTRFDVEAKIDEADTAALKKLPPEQAQQQRRLMLQSALADRFKLKVHQETKELPIYELVVAKGGLKLKEADPNDTYANGIKGPDGTAHAGMMMMRNGSLTAQGVELSGLANMLSRQLRRVVFDKTELKGKYDFTLQYSTDDMSSGQDTATINSGPSIFTALQEQLGLKLESTKGPLETIAVDHVEVPSEN